MIIKIADFYYNTTMSEDKVTIYIDKLLVEHMEENDGLDIEHFTDTIDEHDDFETADEANSFDLEYSMNELELRSEEILEEQRADVITEELEGFEEYEALYSEEED